MKFITTTIFAAIFATSAAATTVNLTREDASSAFGAQGDRLYATVNHRINGNWRSNVAGAFRVSDGQNSFTAWCIQLLETLSLPNAHTVTDSHASSAVGDNINRLFSTAYDSVDTSIEAAAFQTVLWELTMDTDANSVGYGDLDAGTYRLGTRNAAVYSTAQTYLADALNANVATDWTFDYYTSPDSQNLVTGSPSPVPLPATALLLGGALLGFGALGKRKAK